MYRRGVEIKRILILTGRTDMRRGIEGLVSIVRLKFALEPLEEGTLFLFCGTRKDRIKGLLFQGDRFTLFYIRLTTGYFKWPRTTEEARELSWDAVERLLGGFDIDSTIKI